jgi:hypothetical protein
MSDHIRFEDLPEEAQVSFNATIADNIAKRDKSDDEDERDDGE